MQLRAELESKDVKKSGAIHIRRQILTHATAAELVKKHCSLHLQMHVAQMQFPVCLARSSCTESRQPELEKTIDRDKGRHSI